MHFESHGIEATVFWGRDRKVYVLFWDGANWTAWGVDAKPAYHFAVHPPLDSHP